MIREFSGGISGEEFVLTQDRVFSFLEEMHTNGIATSHHKMAQALMGMDEEYKDLSFYGRLNGIYSFNKLIFCAVYSPLFCPTICSNSKHLTLDIIQFSLLCGSF